MTIAVAVLLRGHRVAHHGHRIGGVVQFLERILTRRERDGEYGRIGGEFSVERQSNRQRTRSASERAVDVTGVEASNDFAIRGGRQIRRAHGNRDQFYFLAGVKQRQSQRVGHFVDARVEDDAKH